MTQASKVSFSALSSPRVYDAIQSLLGAGKGRRDWASQFIRARAKDYVLDIGCGTARILDFLPSGVSYWGFDLSERYIAAAGERYGRRARFICGEFTAAELSRLPQFDIVLAAGLLHHLDDENAASFMHLARTALRPGGRLVTIDPCYAPGQAFLARVLIDRDRGRNVRLGEDYLALARRAFSKATGTLRHRRWPPYTHWIMECQS
jgi:SAM-dependent methyltransferase